jgi:hypothetical protein
VVSQTHTALVRTEVTLPRGSGRVETRIVSRSQRF